jgi:6-phosphogluconolactonase (cycloisomerase 2 family)
MLSPTRRVFLQSLGALPALGSLGDPVHYKMKRDAIEVFRRVRTQSVPSRRPVFLALDARCEFLFAVNQIADFQGLPTGSIESYAIQPGSGHLTLVTRAPLSLSATLPRHLAISPDGQHLIVTAFGGGSYNVLPIGKGGEIGSPTQIIKEIGHGIHPEKQASAHPHSVIFHPSGKFVIGTDLGSDRINVFAFKDGRMHRIQQVQAPAGSGPGHLEMRPEGGSIRVQHEISGLVASYRFNSAEGLLSVTNR